MIALFVVGLCEHERKRNTSGGRRASRTSNSSMSQGTGEVPEGYVAVGRVLGAWGARGDVKVEPLSPAPVLAAGREVTVAGRRAAIQRCYRRGRLLHLKLAGLDDRAAAVAVRDEYLQVREDDLEALPEGEYYRFQLIGLLVVDTDGRDLGRIKEVLSTPENDVFVVNGSLGEILIPAVDEIVRRIDPAAGQVIVEIVPGLLS